MKQEYSVAVIIPALNEEDAIVEVLNHLPLPMGCVTVADNGSTDRTAARARAAGARVVHEPKGGYGRACLAGIRENKRADVIVFLDGDKTQEEENILLEIISIFKSYEYKIIFKTHPTFLKIIEPNLYKNLRSEFGSSTFLTKDIDTEELLLEETPSFVITWLSTAACISLRAGIIPICIEENENFYKLRLYEPYPYKRRTLYWKEENSRLEEILLNKEEYQKNLNLLTSR